MRLRASMTFIHSRPFAGWEVSTFQRFAPGSIIRVLNMRASCCGYCRAGGPVGAVEEVGVVDCRKGEAEFDDVVDIPSFEVPKR